jgi:hypothetical protein
MTRKKKKAMTVKDYFETHSTYTADDEERLLKIYQYLTVRYDGYLRVAKHRDGRYFVVDYNGDLGLDEPNEDIEKIVARWYTMAN